MFERDSRYAQLPLATHTEPDGREIVYVTRRLLPRTDRLLATGRVRLREGDRLELAASRALSEAEAWWRLMDANPCLHPQDAEFPGSALIVAVEAP